MTDLVLHIVPAVVTNHIRWYMSAAQAHLPEEERRFATITDDSELSWSEWRVKMVWPYYILYWCWQIGYQST